jgi:Uma2 family endonuclease
MGQALAKPDFDRAAYFEWEAGRDDKHEYLAGEVFAMVGARQEHVVVAGALFARLREHLRGTRCRAYVSDMKLEVAAADAVFYPDVMVSCDEDDRRASLALHAPCLVVEVLSESTAAGDRGPKFAAYRLIPTLQDYLLVDIDARRLELYTRHSEGWLLRESTPAQPWAELGSIGLRLTLAEAFGDLDEAPAQAAAAAARP